MINSLIYSFSSEPVWLICIVNVPVRLGGVSIMMEFFIMDVNSPYNAILGRNRLGEMKAMASPFHQKLKFSSPK